MADSDIASCRSKRAGEIRRSNFFLFRSKKENRLAGFSENHWAFRDGSIRDLEKRFQRSSRLMIPQPKSVSIVMWERFSVERTRSRKAA
jgi:hypothetical protein